MTRTARMTHMTHMTHMTACSLRAPHDRMLHTPARDPSIVRTENRLP